MSVMKPLEDIILGIGPAHAMIFLGDQKTGKIHDAAGLNWGHGKGNVAKDAACFVIRSKLIKGVPHLFPNKGINPGKGLGHGHKNISHTAEALWDDGTIMKLSFEGRSKDHFKTITSFPKNNILGTYIRGRLGLNPFEKILDSHLNEYGRHHVEIKKLKEGQYEINFSKGQE